METITLHFSDAERAEAIANEFEGTIDGNKVTIDVVEDYKYIIMRAFHAGIMFGMDKAFKVSLKAIR